jgi:MFS family permease
MLLAGACFLAGVVLCAAACALGMLITGRILLGFGVGFANQACTPSGFPAVLAWFHVAGGGFTVRNLREAYMCCAECTTGQTSLVFKSSHSSHISAKGTAQTKKSCQETAGVQAVPVYLSEMAPARLRGALNIMFQLATSIGALAFSGFLGHAYLQTCSAAMRIIRNQPACSVGSRPAPVPAAQHLWEVASRSQACE